MNEFGLILLGVAARSTLLALVGLAASWALKRRGPSAGALASLTTLGVLVGVAALAMSPWPRWWSPGGSRGDGPGRRRDPEIPGPRAFGTGPAGPHQATDQGIGPPRTHDRHLADFAREFGRELASSTGDRPSGWRWPAWVALAFLVGLAVAMGRLGLGLWAVRSLRGQSRPIDDPRLRDLLEELRGEMGLTRPVEVREAAEVGTPATVGWRRPVILLPTDWTDWDLPQLRAVLAHELAHVHRGDYLAGFAAQVSLSVHFYHPLVHVLAGRLRLQQELAADAWGARFSGGRRPYLTALATLALRQAPTRTAWPARPFLPTRGTFLRRIEMLRDPNVLQHSSLSRPTRAVTVAALVLLGLTVAGFRGPTGPSPALAQEPAKAKPEVAPLPPLDPSTAASDVHFVLDIRPLALLKNRDLKKLVAQIPPGLPRPLSVLVSGEVEQVLVLGFDPKQGAARNQIIPPQFAVMVRTGQPYDWKPLLAEANALKQGGEVAYYRFGEDPNGTCVRILDDRTIIAGSESDVLILPIGGDRPKGRQAWGDAWKKLSPGAVRAAFDVPWMLKQVAPNLMEGRQAPFSPITTIFGPLFEKVQAYGLTLDAPDGLTLTALATCGSDDGAARVADTVRAALALSRNAVPDLHKAAEQGPRDAARPLVDLVESLDATLGSARVEQDQTTVKLLARVDASALATAASMVIPAARAQQVASKRFSCVNHQKQIGLAIHNYESANGCFPPAVGLGPDGKTPHSWRVAILPYLEAADVYKEYNFSEPWDGPNNKKLIARMPEIFSCPDADPQSIQSGFTNMFVLTGPDTLFPDRPKGTRISEITDGTSNTIMVVEAKRQIPWTKPEDLPVEKEKPLPEMGGLHPSGTNVGFADGSVRFLKDSIAKLTLRALFTRNGGEVISFP